MEKQFPSSFVWGASTSAYQIEGDRFADGAGESTWDQFCRKPGKVWGGHDAARACEHYRRYREDVGLLAELGLQAYHFSVSWPRVLPDGDGSINERGLDFYDRLVDALLERGVAPWVTLFHWDYPSALYARGGWLNRDSANWFARYAEIVVDRLSDRVRHFITLGEPECFITAGHQKGGHAPGDQHELRDVLRMGYHAFLAHGRAVQAMRAAAHQPLRIGMKSVGEPRVPYRGAGEGEGEGEGALRPADVEAARALTFRVEARPDAASTWYPALWMDPVYLGRYPDGVLEGFGRAAPTVHPDDLEVIGQPLDFFALNTYKGSWARAGADGPQDVPFPPGYPMSAYDWPVVPEAIYWGARFFHERYRLPIVVTENGLATADWVELDGRVRDAHRIDFVRRSLRELHRGVAEGLPIEGYFHWSAFDNFEWEQGYKLRFGMIHVDFETQRRTPKDSAYFFREVIRTQGRSLWTALQGR